ILMSKSKQEQTPKDNDLELSSVESTGEDEPANEDTVNLVNGVIEVEEFDFGTSNGGRVVDEMAIGGLFAPGFKPELYDWSWFRHNRLNEAKSRYFTRVDKGVHGKWFKPSAFTGTSIVCGQKYMTSGKPEFYLHVRSIKAKLAENEAEAKRISDS